MKLTLTDFQAEMLLSLLGEKVNKEYYAILLPIYKQLAIYNEDEEQEKGK